VYEHHHEPLLSRAQFLRRVSRHWLLALGLLVLSLVIGTTGYHFIGDLAWVDAFANASMILSGMGPVNVLLTPAAKLFAAFYALYSGVVFIATAGVLLGPFVHRLLHRLHAER
jgi:hypothetical protein